MDRITKIALIIVFAFLLELVNSCCDCPETKYFYYSNCSLTVKNLDNSGKEPIISQNNIIPKEAFGIRISIGRSENVCEVKSNSFSLMQSAYGYDCFCPSEFEWLPLDSIVSVNVITDYDFNSEHEAGTDVSEYFFVYGGGEFAAIDEYIGVLKNILYDFNNPEFVFDLLLMTPPTMGTVHQFDVNIELSDGRILNAQTETMELN